METPLVTRKRPINPEFTEGMKGVAAKMTRFSRSSDDEPDYYERFGPSNLIIFFQSDSDIATKLQQLENIPQRKILERLGAQRQCMLTIGNKYDNCWLCGEQIIGQKDCEHILPIGIAILFHNIPNGILTDEQKEYFKNNYRWAHPRCNAIKGNRVFLKIITKDGKISRNPSIHETVIEEFITEVHKSLDPKPNFSTFHDERKTAIIEDLKPILNSVSNGVELNTLVGVSNVLSNIDRLTLSGDKKIKTNSNGLYSQTTSDSSHTGGTTRRKRSRKYARTIKRTKSSNVRSFYGTMGKAK